MDMQEFSAKNRIRADMWHGDVEWSLLEWAGAMCGEAGEAANIAKKIKRIDDQLVGNRESEQDRAKLVQELIEECADLVTYADLLVSYAVMGDAADGATGDLWNAVAIKFNKVSARVGSSLQIHSGIRCGCGEMAMHGNHLCADCSFAEHHGLS